MERVWPVSPGRPTDHGTRLEGTCLCVGLRRYRNFKYLAGIKSGYLDLESAAFPWAESAAESTVSTSAMASTVVASSAIFAITLQFLDHLRSRVVPCRRLNLST